MSKEKTNNFNLQPPPRSIYAWNSIRAGDFIIFKKSNKNYYEFIYVPGGDAFNLTFEDFTNLIKTKILEFIEQLPEDIYNESINLTEQHC